MTPAESASVQLNTIARGVEIFADRLIELVDSGVLAGMAAEPLFDGIAAVAELGERAADAGAIMYATGQPGDYIGQIDALLAAIEALAISLDRTDPGEGLTELQSVIALMTSSLESARLAGELFR